MSAHATSDSVRDDLLHAIDFNLCIGPLGYESPEALLAAYDASRAAAPPEPAVSDAARRTRYGRAIVDGGGCTDLPAVTTAVIAVADAEQADRPTWPAALREAARLVGEYTGNTSDASARMLGRLADGTPRPNDPTPVNPAAPADWDLRDRITRALDECRSLIPTAQADAVLAVLPAPADRAADTPPPALTEEGRLRARVQVLEEDAERDQGLAKVGARCMREGHQGLIETGRAVVEGHRFALSVRLGLGTDASWDSIYEQVAELRRMADEAQQTQPAVGTVEADPARIDRLRPEFTEHSSVEAIDTQLRRARSQERRWHIRTEWLISLRQARIAQKENGEWPAAQQNGARP
ncbi:hypothetical protein GPA10_05060 [Streptomyces sp. p1417]|uniref:Uncharacterized protein n=1 Tax=Streptomyces typhae TaxID=2681492 RepID=A0A6L6WPJ0_9ACTN|nr:hypothetical protein [Streptomyces typhae]MVO84155.1 hypothetical protein [Streptomyces typhae]